MIEPSVVGKRVTPTTIALGERRYLTEEVDERKWVLVPPSVAAQYWSWIISQVFPTP